VQPPLEPRDSNWRNSPPGGGGSPRKNQLAVLPVLGSCGLGWLPGTCSRGGASGGPAKAEPAVWSVHSGCACYFFSSFFGRVLAVALAPSPSPAHAPRSHMHTGPPATATSSILVLFSRCLHACLCVLVIAAFKNKHTTTHRASLAGRKQALDTARTSHTRQCIGMFVWLSCSS
jgi:hypothetical protein